MRNRYLDLLRAAAIGRVIVYHLFGWPWLTIVLPAMGVMFALAGSLMAASLDKRSAGGVVGSRLRRLLPPLWAFGLVAVPMMMLGGWLQEDSDHPFSWAKVAYWVVPVGNPGGSERGIDAWEPLWYLRAYLWFVVLSPLLYPIYRRIGWAAVAAPVVLLTVLDKTGFSLPGDADAAMWDFAAYGACWIAGFTHHDGRLARTRPWAVVGAAVLLGGAALHWLRGHPGETGFDLNEVPQSQALWSLAFVLLALRWQPSTAWLGRARPVAAVVTMLNGRAVTIYLWHNVMIAVAWTLLELLALDDLGRFNGPVTLLTVLALTAVATMMFGWVEDLAARRRPRLWPGGGTGGRHPRDAHPAERDTPATGGDAPGTPAPPAVPPAAVPTGTAVAPAPAATPGHPQAPVTARSAPGAAPAGRTGSAVAGIRVPDKRDDPDPTPVVPLRVPTGPDAAGPSDPWAEADH